jgi:transcriptional regulator with XRE-family HTH domain
MKAVNSFSNLFREAQRHDDYWVADAIHTFTEDLCRLVEENGISRAELARRLGTSKAYITKVFKGDVNFTIETMVKLTRAAEGRLGIHVTAAANLPRPNRQLTPDRAVVARQSSSKHKMPTRRQPKKTTIKP